MTLRFGGGGGGGGGALINRIYLCLTAPLFSVDSEDNVLIVRCSIPASERGSRLGTLLKVEICSPQLTAVWVAGVSFKSGCPWLKSSTAHRCKKVEMSSPEI